ncbi:hypothetical protein GV828_03705 [Flavobacterium sp. NST-5]|uniref:Tetratricopeptide repeat protein n=1 Tax=Flavobacterium ichthyis TaxID=2698827 RepID=A0ABW9ZB48_9FLAO|nr:hypothetical protein [Flavobacterium ichthyis]NBL64305.1 hypothetical protein [Flavobacterium ichthyis]
MKKILLFLVFLNIHAGFSQQNGYWDKDRATTIEIVLTAGSRIAIKSEDLPTGTTEIVYRITLLDDNQQLASSLVSLLKSIPDPSGISQGGAGAVFLMSKVSGDDKCKYGVFSSEKNATDYEKYGKLTNACFAQNKAISKDAKRITAEKSDCFTPDSENIWFGFESQNWIMKQKIVLEIVPWVDAELSRGWNVSHRQSVINQLGKASFSKKMINKNELALCVLEKLQQKYRYKDFTSLLNIEQNKITSELADQCFSKPSNGLLKALRNDGNEHFKNQNFADAIDILKNIIIEKGNANALDYNNLAYYYLFSNQYDKAFQTLKTAQKLDDAELLIDLNLAHYYMLTGEFRKAKEIHLEHLNQNVSATKSWKNKALSDFEEMKNANLNVPDLGKIIKVLED